MNVAVFLEKRQEEWNICEGLLFDLGTHGASMSLFGSWLSAGWCFGAMQAF